MTEVSALHIIFNGSLHAPWRGAACLWSARSPSWAFLLLQLQGWWAPAWERSLPFHRQPPPSTGHLHSLRFLPPNPLKFRGSPQQPSARGTHSRLLAQSCSFHLLEVPAESTPIVCGSSLSNEPLNWRFLLCLILPAPHSCFQGPPPQTPTCPLVLVQPLLLGGAPNKTRGHDD